MATKSRDYTLSLTETKFRILIDRASDTQPEIITREDLCVDNRHEITSYKSFVVVILEARE